MFMLARARHYLLCVCCVRAVDHVFSGEEASPRGLCSHAFAEQASVPATYCASALQRSCGLRGARVCARACAHVRHVYTRCGAMIR